MVTPDGERAGSSQLAFAFIVASRIAHRHHGHTLYLVLSAIRRHHSSARVALVDNDSPVPLSLARLPDTADRWFAEHVRVIFNRPSVRREWGAYHKGLSYLVDASGDWSWLRFEQFVFLQGGVLLTEAVPPLGLDYGGDRRRCAMRPLGNLRADKTRRVFGREAVRFFPDPAAWFNRTFDKRTWTLGCAHTSFTATADAVHELVRRRLLEVGAATASKEGSEYYAGHLAHAVGILVAEKRGESIPRASDNQTDDMHCDLAIRWPVAWRSGTNVDQLSARMRPTGYAKLHGSGGVLVDLSVAGLMRLADGSLDGYLSRAEVGDALRLARRRRRAAPGAEDVDVGSLRVAAAKTWRALCVVASAVATTNGTVRRFVRQGAANVSGPHLARTLQGERQLEAVRLCARRGPRSPPPPPSPSSSRWRSGALYWAEESAAMLSVLRWTKLTELPFPNRSLLGPLLQPPRPDEPLWGPPGQPWIEWGEGWGEPPMGSQPGEVRSASDEVRPAFGQSFARPGPRPGRSAASCEDDEEGAYSDQEAASDADRLMAAWDDDGDGRASLDEIRRSLGRATANQRVLQPLCLRADVLGARPTRERLGLLAGLPARCDAEQLRQLRFDEHVHVLDAMGSAKWWSDWDKFPAVFSHWMPDALVAHTATLFLARASSSLLQRERERPAALFE